jgi:integrase
VSRQVQRANGGDVELRAPKYGSERTVYAPDGLVNLLSEHVRLYGPTANRVGGCSPARVSHPLHQNSVGYWWRRARGKASLDFRLHDLRRFYASGLIHAGCDVVTVQRASGHSSATVALSTYSRLWPKAEDRTRKAAAAMFAASVDTTADRVRADRV